MSILLMVIGVIAMTVSMYMNSRFAWTLTDDIADRAALALLHLLIDPAAGCLVVAGALMLRWEWRWQGSVFLAFAVVLVAWSMLSVYGFMSSRIAMVFSHDKLIEFDKGRLNWTQNSSVRTDVARRDRSLLRGEAKELSEKIREELAFIPDAQATSIAAAIGAPVETVQRTLVMVSSGVAQTIKFVCLLAGGMIWPRRHPSEGDSDRFHQDDGTGGDSGTDAKLKPAVKPRDVTAIPMGKPKVVQPLRSAASVVPFKKRWTPEAALADLQQQLTHRGSIPSQAHLVKRWGTPKPTVSRWLRSWTADDRNGLERFRAGKTNTIRRRIGDGGSRQAIVMSS